ncbi:hypothetical protein [Halodesulfurarchaeum formicicum]|uniref:hypothetical protein n=1 Tax=Halodesulfurarchaeum formicicum TaxID=1873524 RepID=UPI000878EB36|nr:hypothetical protein [Halodesulfurarchaeum formicicum]
MNRLVADTSALVSLGVVSNQDPSPLSLAFEHYEFHIPNEVESELHDVAAYTDTHGQAATAILGNIQAITIENASLDQEFPLDDGENAAVTLANDLDAELFLCDEFNKLGLIHASLADTRLLTTPTLLSVLVNDGALSSSAARNALDTISDARSWETNAYVQRARTILD